MEKKAQELREKGLCKVKYDRYIVHYKRSNGRIANIRMDYLNAYIEEMLRDVVKDLENSPLVEEMMAKMEILTAIDDNARMDKAAKKKKYDEFMDKHLRETEKING